MANKDIRVSLIVPMYGKWNMTMARLGEFRTYLPNYCEIIVIDDCSPEPEQERIQNGIAFWQKSNVALHDIRFVVNKTNLGFGGSLNKGSAKAKGDILIFYSNDVVSSGDFVTPLVRLIDESEELALYGHRLIYWGAGWNEFNLGKPKIVPYLEGYFIACKSELWEQLGGWDTRYGKYDYEDVDLSMATQVLGYNLVEYRSQYIKHVGAGTIGYTDERMKHTQQNKLIFIEKWKEELI